MAFPQQNVKVVKSFNQKRRSKFDDDHNFHVIMAPGTSKNTISAIIFGLVFCSFNVGAIFRFLSFRRHLYEGHQEGSI